jgi:hypothetical protein
LIARLFLRGAAVGVLAGLLAGAFAFAFAEPQIEAAIAFEQLASAGATTPSEAPPVSRNAQRGGLFLATALFGLSIGGLFALAFAVARGRVGVRSDVATALGLAAVLFLAAALLPALKYPANPPAVGDPETITPRTLAYLFAVAISLLAAVAGWRIAQSAPARWGKGRWLAGAAVGAATVAGAFALLPPAEPAPPGFPPEVLRDFRWASLGTQLVLWAGIGSLFALWLHRRPLESVERR